MKKIIRLTESDIYNLVKRVINEQNNNSITTYQIPSATNFPRLLFQVLEGRLYWVKRDEKDEYYINGKLNGVLSDFKVHYKTGEIIDKDFKNNNEFTDYYWNQIMDNKVNPMESNASQYSNGLFFKFMAIVPDDSNIKSSIGEPVVYTAKIFKEAPRRLKAQGKTESNNEIISPNTYYKKRGVGYYLKLFPGPGLPYFSKFKPDDPEPKKSFDLDITSPFKYDSDKLTDLAEIEFKKFIKSVNDKYKNINANVQVTCSSSIDGDPEGKIGNQKRKDYNMELSKRRAETIVTTLKENLKGFKLNYTPIGIGETDKYAPGKKWPEFKQEATAPNRRLIIKIQTIQD